MSRCHLLWSASAAALACFASGAFAQAPTTVTGGGSSSAEFDYFAEFAAYNAGSPVAQFLNTNPNGGTIVFWPSGSSTGQLAFLNDDNTCNSSKVLTGTTTCTTGGGANAVAYGASDSTLSSTQISSWATIPFGQVISGGLIQVPSMGVGVSFPIVNSKFTKNGQAAFTDHDLCSIFSGAISDWSQTSFASAVAPGTITVVFRGDGSGTSFLFLNHLTSVCTGANAPAAGVTLAATNNFATIFPTTQGGIFQKAFVVSGVTYYTPVNFQPETGSSGVANYLSGQGGAPVTSATAFLTPDYTTIDPKSNVTLGDGSKSKLVVGGVVNASNGTAYTPTNANITLGLNNALSGQNLTPPKTPADLANPAKYVPLIQTTTTGYPVLGYSTFDLAQCYANTKIGTSIKTLLNDHYNTASYKTIEANNGFVALKLTKAAGFLTAIKNNILGNKGKLNLDIGDKAACKGLGR